MRSPWAALQLPFRLVRAFLIGRRRVRAREQEARQRVAAGSPEVAAPQPAPTTTALTSPDHTPATHHAAPPFTPDLCADVPALSPAYAPTPTGQTVRKDLPVAAVMDEFSWRAWQYEAELVPFTPHDWQEVFAEQPPRLLLIESAWSGVADSWYFQLRDLGQRREIIKHYALPDIIRWCRERDIPTVFYNKEDPPNFDIFIDTAKLFDYVFTSDANCIPDYKKQVGHARVHALPFAAQPRIHNPIATVERPGAVCFAGTWYAHRHFSRHDDAEKILRPALEFGLDIFDRMANSQNDNYRWPDVFQPVVRGALPYAQMVHAYKYYKVFININSVVHSPTMFSRRVFELLASGTPVISAYSEGIENLLGGDLVLMSEDEPHTRELLERVLHDDEYRARLALRGQRKVFSEHTYTHRLSTVLKTIGLDATPVAPPRLTVLATVESAAQLAAVWENYDRQNYAGKRLIVCLHDGALAEAAARVTNNAADVHVTCRGDASWGTVLHTALEQVAPGYVVALNPRDYYGEHYLTDLAHATQYARGAALGKAALYQAQEGGPLRVVNAGQEYRYVDELHPWTLCVPAQAALAHGADQAAAATPEAWWAGLQRAADRRYAMNRFNYVRHGDSQPDAGTPAQLEAALA